MSRLNKFLSFGLCVMMIGGILGFKGDRVFAYTHLSEIPSETADHPTISIEFDWKSDAIRLAMALSDVIRNLPKHSEPTFFLYDMLRLMFIRAFERETALAFCGNDALLINKICGILTDIILKDSLESSLKNKEMSICGPVRVGGLRDKSTVVCGSTPVSDLKDKAMSVCGSMPVICLNYEEANKAADEQITNVVGVALTGSLSEIRAVYYNGFGYRLIAGGRKLAM